MITWMLDEDLDLYCVSEGRALRSWQVFEAIGYDEDLWFDDDCTTEVGADWERVTTSLPYDCFRQWCDRWEVEYRDIPNYKLAEWGM